MEGNTVIKEKWINLSDVKNIPHSELFEMVSKVIAEKNLDHLNKNDREVFVRHSFYSKYGKRAIDILLSSIALIVTLPINLLLAICTFFDVGHPIFFRQRRVGYNAEVFTITKFRNMTNEKDKNGDLLSPSERVTKLGKFVRKTSMDELLNFWSVLKGDMSLIGPRPLLPEYMVRYTERHKMRHYVRPGLECPILSKTNNRTWKDQFENDVYYVENISLMLDIKMAFALVHMVFDHKSAGARGSGMRGTFMGYDWDGSSIDSCCVPLQYYCEAVIRLGYEELADDEIDQKACALL